MRSTAPLAPHRWRAAWTRGRALLPEGGSLPDEVWRRRHFGILVLLWAHVPGIVLFGLARGEVLGHAVLEASLVALIATAATLLTDHRGLSTMAAALGLFTCSAVLVHLSGGVIEMHFHFFVMVAVVVLYQEWLPFLSVIGYVVLHHGIAGAVDPGSVYNHPAAVNNPWKWAGVHGAFILAMSAAGIAAWRLNEALRRATLDRETKLAEAQDVARLGSWEWAVGQRHLLWSDMQYRLLGIEPGAPVTYQDFIGAIHPADRRFVDDAIRRSARTSEPFAVDFRTGSEDDEVRWLHGRGAVVEHHHGAVVRMCGTTHDITERKRAEEQLAHQALHDHLTGLPNRALLLDRLDHALARTARTDESVAVLFMDLDRFKLVNDSLGHDVGDRLLVGVAERLRGVLRPADTVARFGGDEFVVLCEDVADEATVTGLAERLLAALREPFIVDEQAFHMAASLGIAVARGSGSRPEAVIRDADAAMYRAKERRRGDYEIFDDETRRRAVQRLHMETGLREALADGQFRVHYQPLVRVADGRVCGAEALLRWQHPEHGLIMPSQFIPVAEDSGLIVPIGAWVLREACQQAAAWQRELRWEEPLEISVNLSARQLLHCDLLHTVTEVLDDSALEAHNVSLCIEVTESMVMDDPMASAAVLGKLKSLGILVGMDDFGTGYSSLAYLRRFPFDIIKIDREFIAELPGAEARAIIGNIVELARALGLTSVAEGVETPAQLRVLRDVGCELAQGFLFARPQPGPALAELFSAMDRQPA